jgi:hypothetical protein
MTSSPIYSRCSISDYGLKAYRHDTILKNNTSKYFHNFSWTRAIVHEFFLESKLKFITGVTLGFWLSKFYLGLSMLKQS